MNEPKHIFKFLFILAVLIISAVQMKNAFSWSADCEKQYQDSIKAECKYIACDD